MKQKIKAALPGVASSAIALFNQHLFCCILPKMWPGFMAWLMSLLGLGHHATTVLVVSVILTWAICTAHFFVRQARLKKQNCACPSHCCNTAPANTSLWVRYIKDTELRYSLLFVLVINLGMFTWAWWS